MMTELNRLPLGWNSIRSPYQGKLKRTCISKSNRKSKHCSNSLVGRPSRRIMSFNWWTQLTIDTLMGTTECSTKWKTAWPRWMRIWAHKSCSPTLTGNQGCYETTHWRKALIPWTQLSWKQLAWSSDQKQRHLTVSFATNSSGIWRRSITARTVPGLAVLHVLLWSPRRRRRRNPSRIRHSSQELIFNKARALSCGSANTARSKSEIHKSSSSFNLVHIGGRLTRRCSSPKSTGSKRRNETWRRLRELWRNPQRSRRAQQIQNSSACSEWSLKISPRKSTLWIS